MSDPHDHRVESSDRVFEGRVIAVRKDVVTMPGDTTSQRDVVEHPGAVGIVALDDQDRVLLVNQYRHPVRRRLDELPAGLLDKAGEPALEAAQRELVEEAVRLGLHALAITDHDGFYGAPMLAEAAVDHDLLTVYGAELSLGLSAPQNGVPDPEGSHLLVLARGVEGYHRLSGAITEAHLRGDEKGRPVYDLDELGRRGRGHWVVLTGCRKGAVRQDVALDLLFYPTQQITVKVEYRHDWANNKVFLRNDGSYGKSNDLLATQFIYSF